MPFALFRRWAFIAELAISRAAGSARRCALQLRRHVEVARFIVKNNPKTMESGRRSFPTAPGWFDAAREDCGIFRLRSSQRAWFGFPYLVSKEAQLARRRAHPRDKKPAAASCAGRSAQLW
jgi:hypothetical protein